MIRLNRILTTEKSYKVEKSVVRIFTLISFVFLVSCSTVHAHLTYDFAVDSKDGRLLYEEGAEETVSRISEKLETYIQQIESLQFSKFKDSSKIRLYFFEDHLRYSKFTTSSAHGSAAFKKAFISLPSIMERQSSDRCKNEACPETVDGVLLHELSHLHLRQHLGVWRSYTVPKWFHEGLATSVSGGAGAGLVSVESSKKRILAGSHFIPADKRIRFRSKTVGELYSGTYRFNHQAQMFVEYLKGRNPAAFQKTLVEIIGGKKFRTVWESNYGANISTLWADFTAEL